MSPARRAFSLVLALVLTIGGAATLTYLLFFANGWKGWMLVASGTFSVVGAFWLYEDFINATPNKT
jgi:hypothetical protein